MTTNSDAVAGQLERRVRPDTSGFEHLLRYGYAPGNYMNTCQRCGEVAPALLVMTTKDAGRRPLQRRVRPGTEARKRWRSSNTG